MPILNIDLLGNTPTQWLTALAVFATTYTLLLIVRRLLRSRFRRYAQHTANILDDYLTRLVEKTHILFLFLAAIYLGSRFLVLYPGVKSAIDKISIAGLLLQAALWGLGTIDFFISKRLESTPGGEETDPTTLNALRIVAKIALWTVIILLILENATGVQVDSLVASLGISGIAVALAVQNILGDLFASLSIALDKPFKIGDYIEIDDLSGTVESIGLKSTRLRSLSGEELVISNSDLLSSRIHNYKRMDRRRGSFTIGVTYKATAEQLARIPVMLEEIVKAKELTTFERAYLVEFGDFAINFECVYYLESPEFNVYRATQQAINLELYRRFAEEGIEFAFPTQTIYLAK